MYIIDDIYIVIYVPVPSFASAGVTPPWYGLTMEGRAHPVLCWQQLHEQTSHTKHATWKERPSVQNAPFKRGEGKRMMMCVYVDIDPGMYLRV